MSSEGKERKMRDRAIPVTYSSAMKAINMDGIPERFALNQEEKDVLGGRFFGYHLIANGLPRQQNVDAFTRGVSTYYTALRLTALETGIEVPAITHKLLNILDGDLSGRDMNQSKLDFVKERTDELKTGVAINNLNTALVSVEPKYEVNIGEEVVFHMDKTVNQTIRESLQNRLDKLGEVEPSYVKAVRDTGLYKDDPEQFTNFLLAARLVHDLYAVGYELKQLGEMIESE